jgi:hypothetical protein
MDWESENQEAAGGGAAEEDAEVMDNGDGHGMEEDEEDEEMNVDGMPVTQEDAWAVIR